MIKANSNNNDKVIHQLFIEIGNYLYNHGHLIQIDDKLLEVFKVLAAIPVKKDFEMQRKRMLRTLRIDLQQLKHKTPVSVNLKNQYEKLYNNLMETYLWIIDFKD